MINKLICASNQLRETRDALEMKQETYESNLPVIMQLREIEDILNDVVHKDLQYVEPKIDWHMHFPKLKEYVEKESYILKLIEQES